ncbi:MAG: hypothetical protein IJN90_04880 [Bacilli bacterium]|nr:hypothetical protein [Bacilli bacterium]
MKKKFCLSLLCILSCFFFNAKVDALSLNTGTYTSKDGHKIVVNEDNTIMYDDVYALTLNTSEKGSTLTGKLGTDKKSVTFYQVNETKIVSGAVMTYKHDGATVYLYDYTVFSAENTPIADASGKIELWRNNSKVNNYSKLQHAVDAAVTGDTIKITEDMSIDGGAYITGKDIIINGMKNTLKSGSSWLNSIFVVEADASLTIVDLTIDGGSTGFKVNYDAINVFNKSTSIPLVSGSDSTDIKLNLSPIITKGNLYLNHSNINNSYVNGNGGAINVVNGNLTLNGATLNHNRSSKGGALYIGSNIKVGQTGYSVNNIVIDNSTISSNYSSNGGAMFLYNVKKVALTKTNFINNTVTGGKGGAILINNQSSGEYYSMLEKLNLEFTDFTADNCLFEGNWVGNDGSSIENHEAELTITNTTFRKNVGIHYSSSCGTVSSYMDYPYEISHSILIKFDNCVFEKNIGAASTLADHGSSIVQEIFNTKFIENKATYNSILLYSADTHFKNCTFVDEYVSRGVVDVQSYNQEVAFEGRPAAVTFENVEFKGTKNSSTDILIRKKDADDINLPWTVIFKGENTANIDLWHKNDIKIDGVLNGHINTDSTILDENVNITKNSDVKDIKINNDKILVSIIYKDIEEVEGYNWESRKYVYVDEKTFTKKEFFLKHLITEDGYELKLYSDSAYTTEWDYVVSKEKVDSIGSVNVYGRWEEHKHVYDGSLVKYENAIYEQCECGHLGKKISLSAPNNITYHGKKIEVVIENELNIENDKYSLSYYVEKNGKWEKIDGAPINEGKYKAVLTINNDSIEQIYDILPVNPNTNTSDIGIYFVMVIISFVSIICLYGFNKKKYL